jgi:signal transduction histidine kinase
VIVGVFVVELVARWRDRPWWDPCVGAASMLLALLYLTDFFTAVGDWRRSPIWVHLIFLACMCVAQVFRRRRPLRALLAGVVFTLADASFGLTVPVVIVLIDLLYCATYYSSSRASRRIVGTVVAFVVAVGLAVSVFLSDWRLGFLLALNGFSVLIVPVWWASNVRHHWAIAEAERANSRQLRRIAELDQQAAVVAERGRMARDLHDVVAGHLSAIAIQSEALLSMVDDDPELVRRVLRSVRENSIQSLTEMRAMIDVLRDQQEDPRTAPARLAELDKLVDSARAGGLAVSVDKDIVDGLPTAVDLAAYRIVQEALTNALKHASGGRAEIDIRLTGGHLVLHVTNSLAGTPGSGTGTGLASMRERAHAVGGTFTAGPVAGGWQVRAMFPAEGLTS